MFPATKIRRFLTKVWAWFWATNTIINYPAVYLIELLGNRIRSDGVIISLDRTDIPTIKKLPLMLNYERTEKILARKYILKHLPVIELGGFVGGVSCYINGFLDEKVDHIVVEANANIISTLQNNRNNNGCDFIIIHGIIAYSDAIKFNLAGMSSHAKSLSRSPTQVNTQSLNIITVDKLIKTYSLDIINLVCDIEGMEDSLIDLELDVLQRHIAIFIVEIHPEIIGANETADRLLQLKDTGFELLKRLDNVYAFRNTRL